MHEFYCFLTGPMFIYALVIFWGGSLYQLIHMFVYIKKKENFIFSFMSFRYSLRSILHWVIPFAASIMRKKPVFTIISFVFHICVLITPVFLLSHIIVINESFNLKWSHISDKHADIMSFLVICCCLFFLLRRLLKKEVRLISTASDFILLILVAIPFVSGFIAYHQWFQYHFFHILHIISGETLLIVLPFSRLKHMLFAFLSRSYTGSEFGGVKNAKDW